MRNIVLSVVLLTMSTLALAQPPSRQKEFILDLSRKKFDWLISKQYDSLTALLDDKVQYIHSNGWTQDKKEIIDDSKSGTLNYQNVTIKESRARLYASTAIVTGLGSFAGIRDGTPFSLELRYTEVYVKTGSRWRLVSRHANRMP